MEQTPVKQPKAIQGNNLNEALFYNQCEFYNFILKANDYPQRFRCLEADD